MPAAPTATRWARSWAAVPIERCPRFTWHPAFKEFPMITVLAQPWSFSFEPGTSALVMIDMQRDFIEPGGFGETLGNDISQLAPVVPAAAELIALCRKGDVVIAKPGKGAFYATPLTQELKSRGITHLIFGGVTTEVCVQTTMREANDRGYECLIVEEATGSYFPEFKASALAMIRAQGAIIGWTATLADFKAAGT